MKGRTSGTRRILAVGSIIAASLVLEGCAAGVVAMQMAPVALTGVATAGADHRSPFATRIPEPGAQDDQQLAALDAHIRRAECGHADSQYWVASAMRNGFNANPNKVEIYKWYRLSEMGSYEPASAELDDLVAEMTPTEVAEGDSRARDWRPSSDGCATRS